jgi:hypothetical protein
MRELLLLNTRVHLRFYARNRLLLAFALLMAGIMGLSMVPMLIWETSADRFSQLQAIAGELNDFALVFVASLGLFAVSFHIRNRSIKLVLTKPCPPGTWLASIFVSAGIVAAVLYGLIALISLGLSLIWKIPLQPGIAFVPFDGFVQSLVWLSFVTLLTVAFHPVVAVMVALFFNDGMFLQLKYLIESARVADAKRLWLPVAGFLCDLMYALLPMAHPFGEKSAAAHANWRVTGADLQALAAATGYAALAMALFYAASLYLLRRKDFV